MPSLPTSTFPLLRALLLWALNHILLAREPSTELALQECAYFCGTRRASHMTSLACLEIAPSKDFSAFLSLHLFQILQIPLCSHAQNFSRWSSERKNMLWCSIPLSYILHLPTLEVFFFFFISYSLLSLHVQLCPSKIGLPLPTQLLTNDPEMNSAPANRAWSKSVEPPSLPID